MKSRANTCLEQYNLGKKLSAFQSCLAKCAECMCHFADGREDCRIPRCPIYPRMPYRIKNKAVGISELNESGTNRPKKVLSPAHKAAMQKGRKSKQNPCNSLFSTMRTDNGI